LYKKYPYGKPAHKASGVNGHVRRGSEGYIVKQLTAEERDELLHRSMEAKQDDIIDILAESSTDYDSLEEFTDDEEREKNGIARNNLDYEGSDSESLAEVREKLVKKRK
jgi:hypothetical protein